ncbi:hypothetical protein D9M68_645420 [compost metagenome]
MQLEVVRVDNLEAIDRRDVVREEAALGVALALPGKLEVLGGQRVAVVEAHTLAQPHVEHRLAILARLQLPAFRQPVLVLERGIAAHQHLEDLADKVVVDAGRNLDRIERGRFRAECHGEAAGGGGGVSGIGGIGGVGQRNAGRGGQHSGKQAPPGGASQLRLHGVLLLGRRRSRRVWYAGDAVQRPASASSNACSSTLRTLPVAVSGSSGRMRISGTL